MIYEQPIVQSLPNMDAFLTLLVPGRFNTSVVGDWRIRKLKEFIDNRPSEARWNLNYVCKQLGLGLSGRQARRLFVISFGVGVREYAKKTRLAKAAEQLQTTNAPVKVIAADAGYQSTCHFARSFKEVFLLRPLEFRAAWRHRVLAV